MSGKWQKNIRRVIIRDNKSFWYYVYSSLDKSPLTISPNIFAQFALDVTVVPWTLVRWDKSPLTYNERQ